VAEDQSDGSTDSNTSEDIRAVIARLEHDLKRLKDFQSDRDDRENLIREDARATHQRHTELLYKLNDAAIDNGNAAIRALLIINGGAVIALLGLAAGMAESDYFQINSLLSPLVWYAAGAGLSVVTSFLAYLTNSTYASYHSKAELSGIYPYIKGEQGRDKLLRWAKRFHALAIISAVGSLALFGCGIFNTYDAFFVI